MGSSGRNGTTMAKLNREGKLREKRADKEARKAARKLNAGYDAELASQPEGLDGDSYAPEDGPGEAPGEADVAVGEADVAVGEPSSHTAALGV
jgi:hypothetical protein